MNKNNRLSDEESSLSMSIMRQSVESVQHLPIRNPLTKTLAISLTTIGSFSEGAQSLFGLSQAFGMDNVFASLASRQGPFTLLKLSYILFGSVMTAIQSFCLEYPYTFDLFDDPLNLFRQHPDAAVHLSVTELSILTAITFLGASVRGVVSIMGYYALSDDIHVALKTVIYLSAFFEISQTIATDGTYLQKAYLWLRSDKQDDEQQTAIRVEYGHDAGENPACETWDSLAVYISCLLLASLSVLGETGLGFIALQQCASQNDFDPQSTGFLVLAALSLSGYFLMMSAIDSASPANMITLWYEQQGRVSFPTTTETLSIPVTCAQRIHYSVALFISMNGAIIKALGAYSGWD